MAVFLEVEQFQSQSPGDLNMVHGESKVHIQVFSLEYPKNSRDKPIKDQPKGHTTFTMATRKARSRTGGPCPSTLERAEVPLPTRS